MQKIKAAIFSETRYTVFNWRGWYDVKSKWRVGVDNKMCQSELIDTVIVWMTTRRLLHFHTEE